MSNAQEGMTASEAARAILNSGCDGVASLTWGIHRAVNGEPSYPPGDAMFDAAFLYQAVRAGLCYIAEGGVEMTEPDGQKAFAPDALRFHANPYAVLRNCGDTVSAHQERVADLCEDLALTMGVWDKCQSLTYAAENHDAGEYVLGDMPAPAKRRFPILRWVYAAHEVYVLRTMGHRWRLTRLERRILKLCDSLDAYQIAAQHGMADRDDWPEARARLFTMARRLGIRAVAWLNGELAAQDPLGALDAI